MDSNNFKTYRINQTGKTKEMISAKDGEWVKKDDYENLLRELNSYKQEWTLENAMLQMCRVIDNLKLESNKTFAMQILANSMIVSLISIKENALKDKQPASNIPDSTKEQLNDSCSLS